MGKMKQTNIRKYLKSEKRKSGTHVGKIHKDCPTTGEFNIPVGAQEGKPDETVKKKLKPLTKMVEEDFKTSLN